METYERIGASMRLRSGKRTQDPNPPGFVVPDDDDDDSEDLQNESRISGEDKDEAGTAPGSNLNVSEISGENINYSTLRKEAHRASESFKRCGASKNVQKLMDDDDDADVGVHNLISAHLVNRGSEESRPVGLRLPFSFFIVIVVLFICLCGVYVLARSVESDPMALKTPWERFEHKFRELIIPKYENILIPASVKLMKNAVKQVIARDNEKIIDELRVPAVITLVGSKENSPAIKCLASDMLQSIAYAYFEDKGDVLKSQDLNQTLLVDMINRNFVNQKKHAVCIDGIESLHGRYAMSLHRFTDHSNAVFKDVIIILTAYKDGEIVIENPHNSLKFIREMEREASSIIEKEWIKALDEDQIAALNSRLLPSVVAIPTFDSSVHNFVC